MHLAVRCLLALCLGLQLATSAGLRAANQPQESDPPPPTVTTTTTAGNGTVTATVTTTVTTLPADPAQAPAAAALGLPIQDAIDGIIDEDDLTRQKAQARLAAATEADLPTLEKYADASDPEVRRQVRLLLKKLKRGVFAFQASFPDHTPAARLKFNIKLYVGNSAPANDRNQVLLANRGAAGMAKELLSAEFAADADGRVVVGRFNDGDYIYTVEPQDPLPPQPLTGKISLQSDTQPLQFEVKRGVTVTVTVTGPDGQPMPDVTVYNAEDANFLTQARQTNPSQIRMSLGNTVNATTNAQGVAVLEKVGLREINILAVKDTYDCAFQESVKAQDGATATVALSMVKTKPYQCTLVLRDLKGKFPAGARILVMRQNDTAKVLGQQWNLSLDLKQVDDYIKNGAIDLGESPAEGEIKTEILPEWYFIVGLSKDGKRIYYSHFNVQVKGGTIQVLFRELPRPAR